MRFPVDRRLAGGQPLPMRMPVAMKLMLMLMVLSLAACGPAPKPPVAAEEADAGDSIRKKPGETSPSNWSPTPRQVTAGSWMGRKTRRWCGS